MDINVLLAFATAFLMGASIFYWLGTRTGVRRERNRVKDLIQSAFTKRNVVSGSLRWVANAVYSGAATLMPEDKFFGPERPSEKTSAT